MYKELIADIKMLKSKKLYNTRQYIIDSIYEEAIKDVLELIKSYKLSLIEDARYESK